MSREVINAFLSERRANWIKKKSTPDMEMDEMLSMEQEAQQIFSLESWLPNAAKRANQLCMVTHPGKFSHPEAKVSPIIAECMRSEDGFLRTGNVAAPLDVIGNAAAMDVFKFLSLMMEDGQTLLTHLEQASDCIKNALQMPTISFETLREDFLTIKKMQSPSQTSEAVKQVYFPTVDGYHLLSILTPSGLIYTLKSRINHLRFSESIKAARENKRRNCFDEAGYNELYGLSMIGYGGTKPQNISVLNNAYHGTAYLLSSVPPDLANQYMHLPKSNFFTNSLRSKDFEPYFIKIHNLYLLEDNNKNIRDVLARQQQDIIDDIIEKMWLLRSAEPGWTKDKNLPHHQKIWLDELRKDEREANDDWLDSLSKDFAAWYISTYEKVKGKMKFMLDDIDFIYLKSLFKINEEKLL